MRMKPLPLIKAAEVTGGKYVGDPALENTLITSVVQDSRKVEEGSLFLCVPGERVDGHDFAAAAYAAGAACCIAERELTDPAGPYILVGSTLQALKALGAYYRSLFDIPVVGVTGSVGKTTAKELTAAVLSQKYCVLKTPLNLNNEVGVPLTLLSLREEHEAAVIEMGISDFGEMSRLAEMVRPDICIMTNIGCCHLENLRDLDGVLKAKSEVFSFMSPDSFAVVCGDDDMLRNFDTGTKKVTFGLDVQNDFRGENVENQGADGISFDIRAHGAITHAVIPAFGSHLVLGALPAAAVGDL
ncbi:MAG: UDP-N-acetylmuramoyl-tripeptide--D-alanyl-D-alanine ligase, partial [Oscillospiraceae bacterium]|nr:UDP-N-acetylmuramoyl-tripeptide--D-alanyl-D-alanine ligase [Oscillospiraceae bacterium]